MRQPRPGKTRRNPRHPPGLGRRRRPRRLNRESRDYTGSAILITPRERSAWYRNIVRDPRVALSIDKPGPPNRRVTVASVEAEIVFAPGREKEWLDVAPKVSLRSLGEERIDFYLAATSDTPRALVSVPFEYPSPFVTTWRPVVQGNDLTGLWPRRYGIVTKPEGDASSFEGWNPP